MHICLNRATAGRSLAFEDFVKLAAGAGFGGADVELGWARQRASAAALRDLFQSHGLNYGGWGVPFDWRGPDEPKRAEGLRELQAQARIARELGIDSCATWLLPSSDRPFMENWNFHVNRLTAVAQALADEGLRLGLEFVAPYHLRRQFRHEFIFTPGQMLELADAIGPNVGLLVDSFHCHSSGTPAAEISKIPGSRIVLVHVNDAPRDVPLHEIQDGQRLLPGDGVLDLRGFVRALKQAGYDGPLSLEVFSQELNALAPGEAARRAWTATSNCFQGVDLE